MIMGPTKKKVVRAGLICFIIPIVVGFLLFTQYKKKMDEQMKILEARAKTVEGYVFARDMAEGEIITEQDVISAVVKAETMPEDAFYAYEDTALDEIVNRRLIIDASQNTLITKAMLFPEAEEEPDKDIRIQEYNMITLPSTLNSGDYVDIRLVMPTGEDYIVISGKEIKDLGLVADTNTIFMELDEEEILRTTAAIIESYMTKGSEIYATRYVKPMSQLFDSKRVDLVELYDTTYAEIKKEKEEAASGENPTYTIDENGAYVVSNKKTEGETEKEIVVTDEEVAARIGVDVKVIKDMLTAKKSEEEDALRTYRSWLLKKTNSMVHTYPVNPTIAKFIVENPNILKDLSAKYDIAKLEAQREKFREVELYKETIDDYTGEKTVEESEELGQLTESIEKKIEAQKTERKEYLQQLLMSSSASYSGTEEDL